MADRTPPEIKPGAGSSCSPLGQAERQNRHLTFRSVQPGARVTRAQPAGRLAGSPERHASIVPVPHQRRQDDRARRKTQPVMTNQASTRPARTTRQSSAGA
jgi:hypothetical protein